MTKAPSDPKLRLLDAALMHVPFDGWSEVTFKAAIDESGVDPTVARAVCPRGAVDLAVAYHRQGDAAMLAALKSENLQDLRFRDRVARAVRLRLEQVQDKELVRRGTTLFALPQYAPDGAKLIWETCDAIWDALGDTSEDVNWYTKRATLAGVYSSTVLYWLGDDSEGHARSWAFLDRRVDNVMQIEKLKAQVNQSPTLSKLMAGPNWILSHIKAPNRFPKGDLPGSWTAPRD
ncbi:ubiquinone biosynthesis protein [Sulfitobacter sp. EhC04]|uniref:COQ9 family protein n=1 Tax=Sulfitobacter sp. EhC04 TaxID=1849168 RepID=UPI0007F4CED0|nr:COQ9 family protein [Sulfitobacter sp. EhC04]OAN71920.1 ubiquinone biosynthesis protein [Sulfitobacter sp. EhC04]